jgi:hypothetical protein
VWRWWVGVAVRLRRGGDDAAGMEEEVAAGRFVIEWCGVMEVWCWIGPSTVPNAQCGQWGGPTRWRCQRRDSTAGCWERGAAVRVASPADGSETHHLGDPQSDVEHGLLSGRVIW